MDEPRIDAPPVTYHLVPREVWQAQATATEYLPEAYEADGFIHCTDGEAEVIAVGNRYYRGDARDYVVLAIARDRVTSPVKYEDAARDYPHIYGPLNVDVVVEVRPVRRDADGTFVAIGE
ncbi:MAG: hypothetical protein QOF73_4813 [Thermomicrobiales bacterium]|nr:hypothetical protein [Thermomicrobiales bacterium]